MFAFRLKGSPEGSRNDCKKCPKLEPHQQQYATSKGWFPNIEYTDEEPLE